MAITYLRILKKETVGHAVSVVIKALCYKPEGREFDSR
jgi:hypothetical protein